MNYLSVEIYKSNYKSKTNISESYTKFAIECESGNLKKEDLQGCGIIRLVKGNLENTVKALFVDDNGALINGGSCAMFGGYYICSSDSRFSATAHKISGVKTYTPVPLHDRFEY
jgi:hypothetical protein